MKKVLILSFLILVASVAMGYSQQKGATGEVKPMLVGVSKVTLGEIYPTNDYIGSVMPVDLISVPAERAGKIATINFSEGDVVKKGDILFSLNVDLLKLSADVSRSKLKQNELNLEKIGRDLERAKKLYSESAVSLQNFEDMQTAFQIQQSVVAAGRAELASLETELNKASVRSPLDGTIIKIFSKSGEWVNSGISVIQIASDKKEIRLNIPQKIHNYLKYGEQVDVTVNDKKYQGKVKTVVPYGDNTARTFPLIIDIDNNPALLGSMEAIVKLPYGPHSEALLVPRDAVVERNAKKVVFTVVDNTTVMVPVDIVGMKGAYVGITKGKQLNPGDFVVTSGNERIMAGQAVTFKPSGKDNTQTNDNK